MHVVLVCASEKKAIGRTAVVLDAYAMRCGERTWITPITDEGLAELRAQLRRTASRATAVACYRNDGRSRMRLLWTVGRARVFGADGRFPIASTARSRRTEPLEIPAFVRAAAVIADAAGFVHDLGKYGLPFQKKLHAAGPVADAIRHEWLSAKLLDALADPDMSWSQAWAQIASAEIQRTPGDHHATPYERALGSAFDVLRFVVVTHHRLPTDGNQNVIDTTAYIRGDQDRSEFVHFVEGPPPQLLADIRRRLDRVRRLSAPDGTDATLYWRAAAVYARMALILADHSVSSRQLEPDTRSSAAPGVRAYANTCRSDGTAGTMRRLNQPLDWHLRQVGHGAGELATRIWRYAPPALSPAAVERIDTKAGPGRFEWQDCAAAALRAAALQAPPSGAQPTLVLNVAATGSGKTRANVRLLSALRPAGSLRVAAALNLRTLTLQTGDSYARELAIDAAELACVIGDRSAAQLHRLRDDGLAPAALSDDDENPPEAEFFAVGEAEAPPAWLEPFLAKRAAVQAVVTTPLAVSTVDFLIAAGEPGRQAHHALAMLRLMSSDLIIDEVDGYDPKPLVAVLRLVIYAAFWGRNVVASSATLARPVAAALRKAFEFGMRMRAAAFGQAHAAWQAALVSNTADTALLTSPDKTTFAVAYAAYTERMLAPLAGAALRPAELWPIRRAAVPAVAGPSPARPAVAPFKKGSARQHKPAAAAPTPSARTDDEWFAAVGDAVQCMHERHRWSGVLPDGQTAQLSIGLVRVATIGTAIALARALSRRFGESVRICCYHSQLLLMHRWYIERRLDALLTRKAADQGSTILAHPAVADALRDAPGRELRFVVVATPVEEIGRDHDFDWAVIEPSSTQSIVQCGGRVNRHRLVRCTAPNVAVLQFNLRKWHANGAAGPVFIRPGLELSEPGCGHSSHDVSALFDWSSIEQIDARLRFGAHAFARDDDRAIARALANPLEELFGTDPNGNLWMSQTTYRDTPLREHGAPDETWCVRAASAAESVEYLRRELSATGAQWVARSASVQRVALRASNDWLVPQLDELGRLVERSGLEPADALSVTVTNWGRNAKHGLTSLLAHDASFGFYVSDGR